MKKILLASAVAATFAAGAVSAQPYIGGAIGQSDYKIDTAGATSADTKDTAFKVFGGYMFSPNFGVEGSLFDLGKATGSISFPGVGNVAASGEVRGLGAYGVAAYPIDDFSIFAKAGLAYVRAKTSASVSGFSASETESSFQPAFGVGAAYNFSKNLGVRAEWERVRVEYNSSTKEDTDLLSVGVVYRF